MNLYCKQWNSHSLNNGDMNLGAIYLCTLVLEVTGKVRLGELCCLEGGDDKL